MVTRAFSRRQTLALLTAASVLPCPAAADEVVTLDWTDLLPKDSGAIAPSPRGVIEHEGADLVRQQPMTSEIRTDWNGRIVKLPGFIVPIETSGTGVTAFILVPFVGACVHVPPPPPNQLVFVTSAEPYESAGLFEPVFVTGMFGAAPVSTQLAEIGYALSADLIEPYSG